MEFQCGSWAQIEVTFDIDVDGILSQKAREKKQV
jgi:molecular chaperone DnaK (HSP70)